jgi:quercetin dioxygenase-like cupin family protein
MFKSVMLATVGAGIVFAQSAYPPAWPREGATKLFENDRVIAWETVWKAGVAQPMHEHKYDLTGVFLRWGRIKVTRPDGTSSDNPEPFEVPRAYFQAKGVIHIEEGMGQPERHAISIEIKEPIPPPLEPKPGIPLAFLREGAKQVLDNARVAIWDYTFEPGKPIPMHFHDKDAVIVYLEPGTVVSKGEDGREEKNTRAYKQVVFSPRGRTHTEEAVSGRPRAMIIELK